MNEKEKKPNKAHLHTKKNTQKTQSLSQRHYITETLKFKQDGYLCSNICKIHL